MSPELIPTLTILGVGVSLAAILRSGQRALRSEMRDLRQSNEARFAAIENQITDLRERMAKLEGLLEGLREAIVARAAQNVTQ